MRTATDESARRCRAPMQIVAVVVTALLLAAACSDSDDAAGPTTSTAGDAATEQQEGPPGDPPQTVERADVDAAIEQIPAEVDAVLAETGVPGMTVTVVFEDEVVFAEGFGVKDVEGEDPVGSDTVFQVASLSKPISATVVAGMVADGTVSWDDPVVEYLPDFALSDPAVTQMVTIGDLFAHRSGLPDHAGDLLEDLGYDRQEIIDRLALLPLEPFRDNYAYTNFGLTAGAEAAASGAGTTWEEASEQVLFGPAGMENTSATFDEFISQDDRAVPHQRDAEGNWVAEAQREPDAQAPAGGVSSTANDMGRWLRLFMGEGDLDGEQILDADALAEMQTPQQLSTPPRTPSARSSFYGFGLGVGTRDDGYVNWSHSGAFLLGTGTAFGVVPGQQVGVAVLTNGQPVGAADAVVEMVLDLVIDGEISRDWLALYGQAYAPMYEPATPTDWSETPADPAPPADPATYLGTYQNEYYGPLEVVEQDGGLVMILGPDAMEFPLEPFDGDSFLFTPPGENSVGPTGIVFTVEGGTATAVTAEFYDEDGLGTWTRGEAA